MKKREIFLYLPAFFCYTIKGESILFKTILQLQHQYTYIHAKTKQKETINVYGLH